MANDANRSALDALLELLVAYRALVYVGGLLAIGSPLLAVHGFGVEPPWAVRAAVIWVSLGVMILTYAGERRLGTTGAGGRADEDQQPFSLRVRIALVAAILGVAVGVYAAIEVDTVVGLLFVAGAILFGRFAFRREGRPREGEKS
jgi:hypothetical protein